MFDPAVVDPVVDLLVEHAGSGRALELGHRHRADRAAARASAACPCTGSSCRTAMAARLRAKPGGDDIGVTIGDFATAKVDGSFSLAYLVYNTIMNLTTQAAQVACFRNVAAHLEPGGCFVIEVMVPELRRLPPGETFHVFNGEENHWGSTSTTSRTRASCPTTSRSWTAASSASRAVPLRLARGARPDGPARRDDAARTLERMEPRAVHEREPRSTSRCGSCRADLRRDDRHAEVPAHADGADVGERSDLRRRVPPGAAGGPVAELSVNRCIPIWRSSRCSTS